MGLIVLIPDLCPLSYFHVFPRDNIRKSFILCINSQGHNLYKLQYISLEEVKIVSFQQLFQSEAIESNLFRLYLKLFTPRSNFRTSKI